MRMVPTGSLWNTGDPVMRWEEDEGEPKILEDENSWYGFLSFGSPVISCVLRSEHMFPWKEKVVWSSPVVLPQ